MSKGTRRVYAIVIRSSAQIMFTFEFTATIMTAIHHSGRNIKSLDVRYQNLHGRKQLPQPILSCILSTISGKGKYPMLLHINDVWFKRLRHNK
jgi:hypothetical protein